MASETLSPTAIAASANYSSPVYTDVADDPDSPDGTWHAWDGSGNTDVRYNMADPSGALSDGAGLQEFRVLIRKTTSGGSTCQWSLELWENGVQDSVLATGTTTTLDPGEVVSGTWNATSIATDANVELRLLQTAGGTGNPNNRRGIEVGAVEWNATVAAASLNATAGFVSSGSSAFNATATPGAVTPTAGFVASGSSAFDATATPGSVTATAGFVASGSAAFDATGLVVQVATAGFVVSASTAFDVTATPGGATTNAGFVPSGSSAFNATASPGVVTVTAGFVASTSGAFNPTATADLTATAGFISSGSAAFNVTATPGAVTANAGFIPSGSSAFNVNSSSGSGPPPTPVKNGSSGFTAIVIRRFR